MQRSFLLVLVVSGVVGFVGCGTSSAPVAEVEGVVTVDGKPIEKIVVEFWPTTTGVRSFGTTDAEGRYKLTTDDGTRAGAVVGSHKVVIHDVGGVKKFTGRDGADSYEKGPDPRVSGKYANAQSSPLSADVAAGKKNQFDFDVEPFGKSRR